VTENRPVDDTVASDPALASDPADGAATAAPARRWNWKWIVGGVALGAVALWAVLFFTVGGDFYATVDEVKAAGPAQNVRVGGRVAPNSITQEGDAVKFALQGDGGGQMNVVFRGSYPDGLGPYKQVVVLGSTTTDGGFEATEVLIKCPDKLFPEKITNTVLTGTGLEKLLY
jgi:cytochrome c-type biogenesis protein CcmE